MPALLSRTSIDSSFSPAAASRMLDWSVTSIGKTVTARLRASLSRSAAAWGFRHAAKTRQPSAAYCRANSKPRPRLALVIMIEGIQLTSPRLGLCLTAGSLAHGEFVIVQSPRHGQINNIDDDYRDLRFHKKQRF